MGLKEDSTSFEMFRGRGVIMARCIAQRQRSINKLISCERNGLNKLTNSCARHKRSLFNSMLYHGPARADCGFSSGWELLA
jgi:hypothetical protein